MKVIFWALLSLLSSFQVLAEVPASSGESFCSDRQDLNFVKNLTLNANNLMPFVNQGGLANAGVCWWHSRFQRNALYLTSYAPELSKPTEDEARDLIKQIRRAENVIRIPGFENFSQFALENEALIQKELEKWQKHDAFIRFAWVKGLMGRVKTNPKRMKKIMDKIYEDVESNKNIAYNKLQLPGIEAHAWLVIHMEKVENGYDLEILDSNISDHTEVYKYREGESNLVGLAGDDVLEFSPYLDQTREMKKINRVISKECNPEI